MTLRAATLCVIGIGVSGVACRGSRALPSYTAAVGGDPARGRDVIRARHCGVCHDIPRVTGASGVVGPPLKDFWRRSFIGGAIANTPDNLVRWIRDPHAVDPTTAMPTIGLDDGQARDVVAFLYSLGDP